jgi:hypothetical protein
VVFVVVFRPQWVKRNKQSFDRIAVVKKDDALSRNQHGALRQPISPTVVVKKVESEILYELNLSFQKQISKSGLRTYFSTTTNKVFTLDLDALTCTCCDFKHGRTKYGVLDVRRACRHLALYREYRNSRDISVDNDLIDFCFSQRRFFPVATKFYLEVIEGNRAFVVSDFQSPWCDVYTRGKKGSDNSLNTGKIECYGYDCIEQRWAYGEAPRNATAFRKVLNAIPKGSKFESEHVDWENLTVQTFLAEECEVIAPNGIVECVFDLISTEKSLSQIEMALTKLENVEGVSFVGLATMWREFGRLMKELSLPYSEYFLNKADALDTRQHYASAPALSVESVLRNREVFLAKTLSELRSEESAEEKSKRNEKILTVVTMCRGLIDAAAEYSLFTMLKDTGLKQLAIKQLDLSIPDSGSKEYRGYQYADFVRKEMAKGILLKKSDDNIKVLDYILSLAVLTGQMSPLVYALMLKYKGMTLEHFQDNERAIHFYEMALLLDEKIGVKRRLAVLVNS